MERMANSIARKLASELDYDDNRRQVMAYGTFAILQTLISLALVAAIGALFGVVLEGLIISFTTSILRKYSGGVHASTPGICTVLGTILCIGQALLMLAIVVSNVHIGTILAICLIAFVWCYYVVIKLAPVDSPRKPIKSEKKRKKMKKGSIIILSLYLMLVFTNIILYLYTSNEKFVIYSLCICIGTTWQAFTLTNIGHTLFLILDKLLNYLVNILKGGRIDEKIE